MDKTLLAPCGINCSLCSGYQRPKNTCSGCNGSGYKPNYCNSCIIKHCEEKKDSATEFCNTCSRFPCKRLKNLEKRYRIKYGVNIYENLEMIKTQGIEAFLEKEEKRWACESCKNILCMHKDKCMVCREKNPYYVGTKK
jgi:hypothetical protein